VTHEGEISKICEPSNYRSRTCLLPEYTSKIIQPNALACLGV